MYYGYYSKSVDLAGCSTNIYLYDDGYAKITTFITKKENCEYFSDAKFLGKVIRKIE